MAGVRYPEPVAIVLRLMLAGELTVDQLESAAGKPAKAKQRDQAIGGFKPRWDNRPNEGSPNE